MNTLTPPSNVKPSTPASPALSPYLVSRDDLLAPSDTFVHRHIGPSATDIRDMLALLGLGSLDELVDQTVPQGIRLRKSLQLEGIPDTPRGEHELLAQLKAIIDKNEIYRSCIGMGYYDTITPPVILRNILENPGWYTQYTPYQAEISQGRLEALLNFQTMVSDLTGLPIANASLLDEGTAAAEAMAMCFTNARQEKKVFYAAADCHPQTLAVLRTRAWSMGVDLHVVEPAELASVALDNACGVLVQYPATDGRIGDYRALAQRVHDGGALFVVVADLLALTLLMPPGEFGADIAVGSAQRFGVPMGFGGPHAAYMATTQQHVRKMPGRLVGISRDADGRPALRLAIQTREQHIKRDRATSNICTAQVLLAIMASMYAVYHGPDGLRRIARRIHAFTRILAHGLRKLGHDVGDQPFFDTLRVRPANGNADAIHAAARQRRINLRPYSDGNIGISLDEITSRKDVADLLAVFGGELDVDQLAAELDLNETAWPSELSRTSDFLTHPVFNSYRCEHEMLRYLHRLQARDLSLTTSMIPLGSCTMKLNGTVEMLPVTWEKIGRLHPYAPADQAQGYIEMCRQLESWLAEITGFAAVSLQPNAGSQGEYAGLLAIRGYHASRGESHRNVCLIPVSAHGTNPASAVIAGFRVVPVACDEHGNIDIDDLRARAEEHKDNLGALMITYPSTHGVFEEGVREICQIIHDNGGQVYMDGANMNAQVGLCRPADIGADVCHLNLHKTFCIPHGGGGPGMGPIGVAQHLVPFLPANPLAEPKADKGWVGPVSAANYGSASILPISWVYIALMGAEGLTLATKVAILNANYMAQRLRDHYPVLFTGRNGRVAHEFIIDIRPLRASAGIEPEDIAKRLMDYGFHAPTMSWPVPGTLMIEPTESESKAELDRFCDAMIAIRQEIAQIEQGQADRTDNVLKNAPHTAQAIASDTWAHPYSREQAAYPAPWLRNHKYWPPVSRIDNAYGDRNLVCTCPPMTDYTG